MEEALYYKASRFYRERYGKCVQRICLDGGFTCPNRDGKCGTGGCIFCGEHGAGDYIDQRLSVRGQVEKRIGEYKGRKRFVAYFQSFSNTYAPTEYLRRVFYAALEQPEVVILSIATR